MTMMILDFFMIFFCYHSIDREWGRERHTQSTSACGILWLWFFIMICINNEVGISEMCWRDHHTHLRENYCRKRLESVTWYINIAQPSSHSVTLSFTSSLSLGTSPCKSTGSRSNLHSKFYYHTTIKTTLTMMVDIYKFQHQFPSLIAFHCVIVK